MIDTNRFTKKPEFPLGTRVVKDGVPYIYVHKVKAVK